MAPDARHETPDGYGEVTARYYDAAYAVLESLGPDVDFYRALAREAGGPVLELGCGTGRVLLAVQGDGHACVGLDASPAMLAALRRSAGDACPELVHAPMQAFSLGERRFALIYAAFRAFQHLATVADQLACLACVRRHLAPGGTFAFDVFAPRLDLIARPDEPEVEDLRFPFEGDLVVRFVSGTRDRAAQRMDLEMRYERRRDGAVVADERVRFGMRWFFRYELEHLLARAGFGDVAIHGDFDRGPVRDDSPAFVVVARA